MSQRGKLEGTNIPRRERLSMENMEFQAKRIKFALKKSARERLFNQLQDANERMRKLLESSDHITTARHQGQTAQTASIVNRKLSDFWRHAKRLHETLARSRQCGCAKHTTSLGFNITLLNRLCLIYSFISTTMVERLAGGEL
jgi:hypothetical protein